MCGEHHVIGHILVHYWGENLQGNWWSSGPAFSTESPVFPCLILPCLWQSTNFAGEIHIIQDHPIKNTIFPYFSQEFPGVLWCFHHFSPENLPRNLPTFPSPEAPSLTVPGGAAAPRGAAELCLALRRGAEGTAAARRRTLDIPETLVDYPLCIVIDDVTIIIIHNYPLLYHYP